MKLTKPMTPAEKDAFCEIDKSRLNYESNSYRIKEIRLWVESWQSLGLPEKLGAGSGWLIPPRANLVSWCRSRVGRGSYCVTLDAWRGRRYIRLPSCPIAAS